MEKMVETKPKDDWNDWIQEGELNSEIKTQLNDLFQKYLKTNSKSIFLKDTDTFTEEFLEKVNTDLDLIFANFPNLPPKEVSLKRNFFLTDLKERLDLLYNKKALCQISFDAYPLYRFIESFSGLVDEVEFRINENNIQIDIMDPSKICLIKIIFGTDNYTFFDNGKLGINLEDLKKVLVCNAGDQSTATLLFGQEKLFITIRSKKYKSEIKRTLGGLDIEIGEIPLDSLERIAYPFEFSLTKEKFEYTLKNLGVYSEVIGIHVNNNTITFDESGQLGNAEIVWKKSQLKSLNFYQELLENELEKKGIKEEEKTELETILSSKECYSYHSLEFINWIRKMTSILDDKDSITFFLRTGHPLKCILAFKKLEHTSMLSFFAPRIGEEEDFDDDEEEEEELQEKNDR